MLRFADLEQDGWLIEPAREPPRSSTNIRSGDAALARWLGARDSIEGVSLRSMGERGPMLTSEARNASALMRAFLVANGPIGVTETYRIHRSDWSQ